MSPNQPIRSEGEWLYHDAQTTGDWQSAAIALRRDVATLGADKAALVSALEAAWAQPTAAPDPLADFLPEVP